jgi:prepilin-type processing-associated H-X9-DG protein
MIASRTYTKGDLLVFLCCIVFFAAALGAIGSGGRMRAKEAVCLSNLQQWGNVWAMFFADNDYQTARYLGWTYYMWDYYRDGKLRLCPAAVKNSYEGARQPFVAWMDDEDDNGVPDPLEIDGVIVDQHHAGSYGMSSWCTRDTGGRRGIVEKGNWFSVLDQDASEAPLFFDCASTLSTPLPHDAPPEYPEQRYAGGTDVNEIRDVCKDRHNGGVNILFLDLSARKVGLKELWLLRWHRRWFDEPYVRPLPEWPEWMAKYRDP